jgi:hypothetical protein
MAASAETLAPQEAPKCTAFLGKRHDRCESPLALETRLVNTRLNLYRKYFSGTANK